VSCQNLRREEIGEMNTIVEHLYQSEKISQKIIIIDRNDAIEVLLSVKYMRKRVFLKGMAKVMSLYIKILQNILTILLAFLTDLCRHLRCFNIYKGGDWNQSL
jgi:hypothetical protein